jgi:hypothetical protein
MLSRFLVTTAWLVLSFQMEEGLKLGEWANKTFKRSTDLNRLFEKMT